MPVAFRAQVFFSKSVFFEGVYYSSSVVARKGGPGKRFVVPASWACPALAIQERHGWRARGARGTMTTSTV